MLGSFHRVGERLLDEDVLARLECGGRQLVVKTHRRRSASSPIGVAVVGCGYWGPKVIRVFSGLEDVDYNHYNLGLIFTFRGDQAAAINHFKRAGGMRKNRGQPATWEGARKMLVYELRKMHRRAEAISILRELAKEKPNDQEVRKELEELSGGEDGRQL